MRRKIVLGLVITGSVAACAFLVAVLVHKGLADAVQWAAIVAALAGVPAAAAAVWVLTPRPSKVPLPPELEVPEWVVGRPAELAAVVKALVGGRSSRASTVGITTGLHGAGGFGKTTLAQMVCADRRVRRRFGGRVYLVTVGRDVRGAVAVAAKVNDVIKLVAGADATFTGPELAGRRLGALLDAGPPTLLVLDDIWEQEQLAPFIEGGKGCARLVTTRVPELLGGRGVAVRVDQMSPEQARALLTYGLPQLSSTVVQGLLTVTGRWPLLLRLVNKILADYARVATDVSAQGTVLLERLRVGGPAVVDDLLGEASRGLDVGQSQERARAVRATIEASTSLLDRHDAERFAELSTFAEDETIPFSLVAVLWRATAGLDDLQAAQVCKRLARLALISQAEGPVQGITLHDVVRDFLRADLGPKRLAILNGMLLDAIAAKLPVMSPFDRVSPLNPATLRLMRVAWWELGRDERYMWDHLIEHLLDAGRPSEAETTAGDLRWVGARLEQFGPAAPAADLSTVGTPRAAQLQAVLTRTAHLLSPTELPGAVVDILHSRITDEPDWRYQATILRDTYSRPRLVSRWPLPDRADPALRRVLTGQTGRLTAVAVAPDSSWLASGGYDGTVKIWDVATGQKRATFIGHAGRVAGVAVAPDGSWLASSSDDGTVKIWDVATGRPRATLTGQTGRSRIGGAAGMAVAPDGSWLASGGDDGTVKIWDVATGRPRATLTGHARRRRIGLVAAVAVAPDGSWLASGGDDKTVRIWDVATGQERATLTGHTGPVVTVAAVPDGSWLASGGDDGTIRIWDVATGQERAKLTGHTGRVAGVAVAPDGSWLASGGDDGTIRIWDVATGQERAKLTGHTARVAAVAVAPDGSWLASGDMHGTVRIWGVATGQERSTWTGYTGWVAGVAAGPHGSWLACGDAYGRVIIGDVATGRARATLTATRRRIGLVAAVAVAPDGSWLASGGDDGTVEIWDVATGQERAKLTGHTGRVAGVAVAPDGSWLASGGYDGTVKIWDVATGQERATLTGHAGPVMSVAVAPDGSWLASGGWDGAVRIWDMTTRQARALMRVDGNVNAITWLDAKSLVVGGAAGLYLFDFLTGTSPGAADH